MSKFFKYSSKKDDEVFKSLKNKGIRYVIGGSYPMRNIRPSHDYDLIVHPQDWELLLANNIGQRALAASGSEKIDAGDTIEMFKESYPKGFSYLDMSRYDTDEYGRPTWTLDQMIKWKLAFGRDKDIKDLKLLGVTK